MVYFRDGSCWLTGLWACDDLDTLGKCECRYFIREVFRSVWCNRELTPCISLCLCWDVSVYTSLYLSVRGITIFFCSDVWACMCECLSDCLCLLLCVYVLSSACSYLWVFFSVVSTCLFGCWSASVLPWLCVWLPAYVYLCVYVSGCHSHCFCFYYPVSAFVIVSLCKFVISMLARLCLPVLPWCMAVCPPLCYCMCCLSSCGVICTLVCLRACFCLFIMPVDIKIC